MLRYAEQWIQLFKHVIASPRRNRERPCSQLPTPLHRNPRKVKKHKQWLINSMTSAFAALVVHQALLSDYGISSLRHCLCSLIGKRSHILTGTYAVFVIQRARTTNNNGLE